MSQARIAPGTSTVVPVEGPVLDGDVQLRLLPEGEKQPRVKALGGAKSKAQYAAGRQVEQSDKWNELNLLLGRNRPTGRDAATLAQIKAIRDLDPQASLAVWNFLRLLNPGHDLKAVIVDKNGEEKEEGGPAQAYLDGLALRVGKEYGGGLDQFHNVLALMLVTNGAICAEIAPNETLDDVEDWYAVDPTLITFKRLEIVDGEGVDADALAVSDKGKGKSKKRAASPWDPSFAPDPLVDTTQPVWWKLTLGQLFRDGTWHELPADTVIYQPLDPDVDDPYGRPPLLSAVAQVISIARMLNDLRAVVHNQGYPRINVTVVADAVRKAAPVHLQDPTRDKELTKWVNDQVGLLISDYESLQVDDTFIHFDWVQVDTVGGASTMNFQGLEQILSRRLNVSLKMLPILQGSMEGTTETHGSIQWQIQVLTIQALQRLIKRTIERLANVSLQLAGFACQSRLHYEKLRQVDRILEANADFVESQTKQFQVLNGWITNDEAAKNIADHKSVGENQSLKLLTGQADAAVAAAKAAANPPAPPPAAAPAPDMSLEDAAAALATGTNLDSQVPGGLPPADQAMKVLTGKDKKNLLAMMLLQKTIQEGRVPVTVPMAQRLAAETRFVTKQDVNAVAERYGKAVKSLFLKSRLTVMSSMRFNGFSLGEVMGEARDVGSDIADEAFGLTFRREVKGLLRQAMREGATSAGFNGDVRESALERIWRTNTQYVDRIRNDLRDAIRDGSVNSPESLAGWFGDNAYREDLMGRFVARQGFFAGYTYGVEQTVEGSVVYEWIMGDAKHCESCLERSGEQYTYEELQVVGFPGSINLDCAANCHCVLEERRIADFSAAEAAVNTGEGTDWSALSAIALGAGAGTLAGLAVNEWLQTPTGGDEQPVSEVSEYDIDAIEEAIDLDSEGVDLDQVQDYVIDQQDLGETVDADLAEEFSDKPYEEPDPNAVADDTYTWSTPAPKPAPKPAPVVPPKPAPKKKITTSPDPLLAELAAFRASVRGHD